MSLISGISEHPRDGAQGRQVLIVDRGRGQPFFRKLCLARWAWADVVPISEAVGEHSVLQLASQIAGVADHGVVVILENFYVAVKSIRLPGRENAGAAPLRGVPEVGAVAVRVDKGHVFGGDGGNEAVRKLRFRDVAGDLLVELQHAVVVHD